MKTLKQVVDLIEQIQTDSILFKSFKYEPIWEISSKPDIVYPSVFCKVPLNETVAVGQLNISDLAMTVIFSDRSLESYLNRLETESRLREISIIFMSILIEKLADWHLTVDSYNFLFYEEASNDRCYSISCDFNIKQNLNNVCLDFINYIPTSCS